MASSTRTVNIKFDGSAKGLIAAANDAAREIDKFGKGTEDKFRKSGDKSGKGFGAGLKKWFKGDGDGLLKEIGKSGGTVFGSGFLGALKTPILGPALVAILLGAFVTVMPAIGAIAGAGLVTGFGAGLAGLGLVFASKADRVQKTWSHTLTQLGSDFELLSRPFESTLVNFAGYFERTVDRFNPALGKSFAKMAPTVDRFVDGAAHSFERLIPAIEPVTDAFGNVLDALSPALDGAIGKTADGLTRLANSVSKNPQALADTVEGLGDFVGMAFDTITILNDVNSEFSKMTGGTSLVTIAMRGLRLPLILLAGPFAVLNKGLELFNALIGKSGKDSDTAGASMSAAGMDVNELVKAAREGNPALKGLVVTAESAATKFDRQRAATDKLIESTFKLQNLALGLSGAEINFQQAIDNATASAKENGKTLDVNTEKGRNNKRALDDVAQSANAQTQAVFDSTNSWADAAVAAENSRKSFVTNAMQMGLSRKEAVALAKSLIAIPNVEREAKLTADKKDLDTKLAAARTALKDPNLTKTRRAKLEAEIAQLLAAKKKAQAAIDALHGKSVYIDAIVRQRGAVKALDPRLGPPGRASGGLTQPNRAYLFGERGVEFGVMGEGGAGRVLSAEETRSLLGKQDGPTVLEAHIEIGGEVVRVVQVQMKQRDRELKRSVMAGAR